MRGGIRKECKSTEFSPKGFAHLGSPHQIENFNLVVEMKDNPQSRINKNEDNEI